MQITILLCKLFKFSMKFCGYTYHHYATSLFALCGAFSVGGNGKVLRQQKIAMETLNITVKFSAQIACRDLMKIYMCVWMKGFMKGKMKSLTTIRSFTVFIENELWVIKAQEIKTLFEKCYFASQNAFLYEWELKRILLSKSMK